MIYYVKGNPLTTVILINMAGTKKGSIKKRLGLRGRTKPGEMISKMNSINKSGSFKGKSNKLGGGGRFAQVKEKVSKEKGVYNPAGLAAYIGRKSLGKAKFQKLSANGKK